MIDRKKLLLRSLIPILACALLGGIGVTANAQTAQPTTQNQTAPMTPAQKRAAKRAAKKQAKEDQKAAANNAAPANTSATKTETKTAGRTTAMNGGPSSSEIASAKAKGLVWVNTGSKVYHTGGRYYGNTKHGKFMTQTEAQRDGYTASKR